MGKIKGKNYGTLGLRFITCILASLMIVNRSIIDHDPHQKPKAVVDRLRRVSAQSYVVHGRV